MNLKSAAKIIKSVIDKKNLLLDQRLIHVVLGDNKEVVLKATSGTSILTIKTGIFSDLKQLGYIEPDSICGMSNYYPDMECMSFIKSGIKFINPVDTLSKSGNAYYVFKSKLDGNFYDGLVQANGPMINIYDGKIDLNLVKKLSHSSKSTDVFGHARMCAVFNRNMYTFRYTSMSKVPFHIKGKMYFDYRDIACLQHFIAEDNIKIKSDNKSVIFSQGNVSLCIMNRIMKKDYVKSFEKAFMGKSETVVTALRKDLKESLVQIKKICKTAVCKMKIKDLSIELEGIYGSGRAKQEVSSFSTNKIKNTITCKTGIDLLLDFIRCGKSESVDIHVVRSSPYNNYLKMKDGNMEELIALRNDGKLT